MGRLLFGVSVQEDRSQANVAQAWGPVALLWVYLWLIQVHSELGFRVTWRDFHAMHVSTSKRLIEFIWGGTQRWLFYKTFQVIIMCSQG